MVRTGLNLSHGIPIHWTNWRKSKCAVSGLHDVRWQDHPEDSYIIIDRAIDAGVNFLDTANVYSRGRSEEVTGEALKRNGKREQDRAGHQSAWGHGRPRPQHERQHRRNIIQQCEASLKRLQTDCIDLYQIHRPKAAMPIDETLRALDDLIRAGKVRYVGTSTYGAWQLMERCGSSKEIGIKSFCVRAAAVSPAGSAHRTRTDSVCANLWHWVNSVVTAGRWVADGQIQPQLPPHQKARALQITWPTPCCKNAGTRCLCRGRCV